MANRIRGITIEIGGDTTKLDKALAGTNKTLAQTQKELKDVERLLKLDPGNTELLQQKQRLLAQAVEATADRLDTLRQAAENADKALQKGKDYQAAYEPLKTELDQVTASMRGLEANAESMQQKLAAGEISTAQYDAFEQKLGDTRKRAEELRTAIADVEQQFSGAKLDQSQYDALQREIVDTAKELENLEDKADRSSVALGKFEGAVGKLSEGAGKVADVMMPISGAIGGIMAAAFATVPATDDLRGQLSLLETNAQMAGVGMESVQNAFRQLNTVSGETDSSLEAVSNLLQAGFTESNLQYAVYGLANAVTAFPDTLKVESLADSLQETLATGKATGQFAELLDRIGYGAESFAENLAMCATEADKQGLALNILTQGPLKDYYEAWAEANPELLESRDAAADMQIALADLAEVLTPIVTKITDFVTDLVEWFTSLDEGTQDTLIALGGITAAIGPMAKAIEVGAPMITKLADWFSGLGANTKIAAIAIAAIVAVLAELAGAWDNMNGAEKVIAVLGLITAAALTAAVAMGAFQSATSIGIAALAIAGGIVAILAAIESANSRAEQIGRQAQQNTRGIPGFAQGGVVPPNRPFLAVLGDNRTEPEVVSPYSTIKQAAGEAIAENGGIGVSRVEIVVRAKDGFTRNLSYSLSEEARRRGVRLVSG